MGEDFYEKVSAHLMDSDIAELTSVDKNGLVKAVANGTAKITVTAGTQSFSFNVTIE